MPSIEITDAKGLVQKTGSGVSVTSTITMQPSSQNVNHSVRQSNRIYLDEYFAQLPGINGDLANTAEATRVPRNKDFEIVGAAIASSIASFDHDFPGVTLTTAANDNDSAFIRPHLDTAQSAWALAGMWDSQNEVEWECCITTSASIATQVIGAGLKMATTAIGHATGTCLSTTDTDQAYFLYTSAADNAASLAAVTTPANWHFVFSAGGTDYITDLDIAVAVSTQYHLKITIDSSRFVRAYINGTQVGLAATAVAAGTKASSPTAASAEALVTNKSLVPFVGLQNLTTTATVLKVHYVAANRKI